MLCLFDKFMFWDFMLGFENFKRIYTGSTVKNEVLSGVTTSLALMPECIAFAIVAHLSPIVGLYTAAMISFIAAFFGGRPGMISGAAGSVAVVSAALVLTHGVEYLFLAVIIMGIIEILVGVFKLAKFIRLVPQPVIYGFLNGLAIIIFLSQLNQFKTPSGTWLAGISLVTMIVLVGISAVVMYFLPKYTRKVPSGLVAIVIVCVINLVLGLNTRTIGNIASIGSGLPSFHIPMVPVSLESISIVLPYAVIMAAVGLIETLLTVNVVDEMTNTRGKTNKESIAQGIANIFCGFFQGMGGCAMIGQTMVNLESGGRQKLSGITAGIVILLIIVFGGKLVDLIPMAALVGVMFVVAFNTFKWSSLKMLKHVPKIDRIVMVVVTAVTVVFNNLALAVLIGVIISALNLAWEGSKRIAVIPSEDKKHDTQYFEIQGLLFFGSSQNFKEGFIYSVDSDNIVINFYNARITDQSAIIAIDEVCRRFKDNGKQVYLSHLSPDCLELLDDASEFIEINILEDPYYRIPSDELD